MKKLLLLYLVLIGTFVAYLFTAYLRDGDGNLNAVTGLHGERDEKYVMVNFLTGIDYWKNALKGFEDAAEALGVSVEYRGSTQYDVHEEVTVLEQVIARKPAGIAITAINSEALNAAINKAVEAGIPVVMFDSDAPDSKAYSFLGTDNYNAGVTAARQMAELVGTEGELGIITHPHQLNHQERTRGFQETLRKEFPDLTLVSIADGKGDQLESERKALEMMKLYPDLRGIFVTEANGGVGAGNAVLKEGKLQQVRIISFDTNKGTLDMVKSGTISATLAQGTWNMGYWSLMQLFHVHNERIDPIPDWQETDVSPLPAYVDTGITVVTQANVDHYYAK
ncbi:ribose transport system substrate-binding protein [Paenibacillus phyllosphaerae]|uniref:Ribose transport system substrate-binding protein n=1 Tax=Paenibacillus phyllosphaerae TaxID=274593 RepID=A0A7W5B1I4_9BACL|nr:substrate-binding domain-containing protein [Paenibacillus phyllosphaerae]MBB3112698.1 ribose transport system substrate-binding protein [Paenibacillus phyllosphaerae]